MTRSYIFRKRDISEFITLMLFDAWTKEVLVSQDVKGLHCKTLNGKRAEDIKAWQD